MAELTSRARIVRDLARSLDRLDIDAPPAVPTALASIHEAFAFDLSVGYRLAREEPRLDFYHELGRPAERHFRRHLERPGWRPHYDPSAPERRQRNRVVTISFERAQASIGEPLCAAGLRGALQMRTLLCEGETLLAWFGGLRFEPPTREETDLFSTLIRPMQRRLALERRLGDALLWRSGLAAAMDALEAPAFIVDRHARLRHANALGAELRDRSGAILAEIREAIAGAPSELRVTKLGDGGAARGYLVVAKRQRAQANDLARDAQAAYRLTRRETEVVALLARGEARKIIADRLGCTLRTVEAHCTSIYRKAKVETGAELVAKLWRH